MAASGFEWKTTPFDVLKTEASVSNIEDSEELPYDPRAEGVPYLVHPVSAAPKAANEVPPGASEASAARYRAAVAGDWNDVATVNVLGAELQTPRGGCLARARVEVFGSLETAFYFESEAANVVSRSRNKTRQAPEVGAALAAWQRCMASHGYNFEYFTDARLAARNDQTSALQIAQADSECATASSLRTIFVARFNQELNSFSESNLHSIVKFTEARDSAVERAKKALSQK
jgi:hypothetical protein